MLTSAEQDLRADQRTLVEAVAMMLPHGVEPAALRYSTAGYIDDVAHSFGRGQTCVSTAGRSLTRIFVHAQQGQR